MPISITFLPIPAFHLWSSNGLPEINDLYKDGVFASFSFLSKKYNLPNQHLFWFFPIRLFIQKPFPHFPNRKHIWATFWL